MQTPFKVFSGVVAEGPNADQNMLNVYANALAKSIYKSVEPFVSPSIAWQTFLDIKPDKNGISKNRYGSTIIDWNNDENPWLKAMTYVYDKALPTTLQNIENIVKAFNGQVTKHSVEMDPLLEVSKTMTGVSIFKVDPIANFKFKIGNAMGGVAQANKRFKSLAINAETLRQDKNLLLAGYTSEHVPKLFEKNQQNTYREWSKAYEDIQAMRNLNYTEQQIKDALTHRGSFSKDDVKRLMLGIFVSNSVPKFDEGTFKVIVDEFNRKNNTGFSVSDFLNKKQLKEIENTWNGIPLGLNEADRLEGLKLPKDLRILFYQKKLAEQIEKKQLEVEQDIERKQELIKKKQEQKEKKQNNEDVILPYFGKAPSIKPNVPIRTAAVSEEVVKTAALPGNINENTGLTRIEEALLSNEEKAMRLRQKGRTA
jgi:hypothetical protein